MQNPDETFSEDSREQHSQAKFGAVVMAAGLSRRMGRPKLVMPWGNETVIHHVVSVLVEAGVDKIIVVTGSDRGAVEETLYGLPVELVWNQHFAVDQMLITLQTGLVQASQELDAVFVVIGDQPQIPKEVIQDMMDLYQQQKFHLVVPSFQMRRGHPWLVDRSLWSDLLAQKPETTLRDWLNLHSDQIGYLSVETDFVLRDLDTPEDYEREISNFDQ